MGSNFPSAPRSKAQATTKTARVTLALRAQAEARGISGVLKIRQRGTKSELRRPELVVFYILLIYVYFIIFYLDVCMFSVQRKSDIFVRTFDFLAPLMGKPHMF